jgi:Putative Actinobacterial Holin-X, holin superfamily III
MPIDENASFGKLFQDAFSSVREIIRSEVRLAKTETKEEIGQAGKAGAVLGGGAILALYALGLLLLAGVSGLALVLPQWLALLVMAALAGLTAILLIVTGRHQIQRVHVKPEKTITTVKENLEWAKHQSE